MAAAGAVERAFPLPVERPGGRFITKKQMERIRKVQESAVQALAGANEGSSRMSRVLARATDVVRGLHTNRRYILLGFVLGAGALFLFRLWVMRRRAREVRTAQALELHERMRRLRALSRLLGSSLKALGCSAPPAATFSSSALRATASSQASAASGGPAPTQPGSEERELFRSVEAQLKMLCDVSADLSGRRASSSGFL
jgi:hypothetical protein